MEWERNSKFTISMTSLGQEWVRLVCWEFCNAWIWKWKKINPGHEIWGSHSGAAGVLKLMIYDVSTYNSYQSVLHCLFAFIMLPRLLVCNLQVLTLRNSIETHKGGGGGGGGRISLWSRVLVEKLTVPQLVEKFPSFSWNI